MESGPRVVIGIVTYLVTQTPGGQREGRKGGRKDGFQGGRRQVGETGSKRATRRWRKREQEGD